MPDLITLIANLKDIPPHQLTALEQQGLREQTSGDRAIQRMGTINRRLAALMADAKSLSEEYRAIDLALRREDNLILGKATSRDPEQIERLRHSPANSQSLEMLQRLRNPMPLQDEALGPRQ